MSYSNADGRAQILAELEQAAHEIGSALSELSEAFELLDERSAERLEEELFGPAQRAYARVQRTHMDFARQHGVAPATFTGASAGGRPGDARGAVERAAGGLERADVTLATLQDSMLPVEVGDPALRSGITEVRELVTPLPGAARALLRVLGR